MGRGVLRPKPPKAGTLAKRPNNRWCEHCRQWVHKDRLAQHSKSKHGIVVEATTAPMASTPDTTANNAAVLSTKRQVKPEKPKKKNFLEPPYERQPKFEGGIRWEQGGLPSLGKRR